MSPLSSLLLSVFAAIGVATVRIHTVLPLDDGGLPLLGCVVLRQENWLGDYGEATLTLLPRTGDRTIDLIGLVPATGYRCVAGMIVSC